MVIRIPSCVAGTCSRRTLSQQKQTCCGVRLIPLLRDLRTPSLAGWPSKLVGLVESTKFSNKKTLYCTFLSFHRVHTRRWHPQNVFSSGSFLRAEDEWRVPCSGFGGGQSCGVIANAHVSVMLAFGFHISLTFAAKFM